MQLASLEEVIGISRLAVGKVIIILAIFSIALEHGFSRVQRSF